MLNETLIKWHVEHVSVCATINRWALKQAAVTEGKELPQLLSVVWWREMKDERLRCRNDWDAPHPPSSPSFFLLIYFLAHPPPQTQEEPTVCPALHLLKTSRSPGQRYDGSTLWKNMFLSSKNILATTLWLVGFQGFEPRIISSCDLFWVVDETWL